MRKPPTKAQWAAVALIVMLMTILLFGSAVLMEDEPKAAPPTKTQAPTITIAPTETNTPAPTETPEPQATCGDGVCSQGEDWAVCVTDCAPPTIDPQELIEGVPEPPYIDDRPNLDPDKLPKPPNNPFGG